MSKLATGEKMGGYKYPSLKGPKMAKLGGKLKLKKKMKYEKTEKKHKTHKKVLCKKHKKMHCKICK